MTEPQKPSTMITKLNSIAPGRGQKAFPDFISQKRRTTISKLKKIISGDLDNICLMAIRKEPERRYSSIAQFISDIDNYLNRLPVTARKSTAGYVTRKFIERHRVGVVVATIAVMLIALVTAFYTIQLAEERDKAQLEAEKSKNLIFALSPQPIKISKNVWKEVRFVRTFITEYISSLFIFPPCENVKKISLCWSTISFRNMAMMKKYLPSRKTSSNPCRSMTGRAMSVSSRMSYTVT